jgi:hypothetical protein
MLGTKLEADQTGTDAAEEWALAQKLNSQRRRELPGAFEYATDHSVLDKQLELLRRTGRKLPTALDCVQVALTRGSLAKLRG